MRSSWARWLRSLSRPQSKTIRKNRAAEYYLRLEPLEDRLAPATLPVPVITSPASPLPTSFGGTQGDHPLSDAQIVVDPRNAQHLVAVASYNPATPNTTTIIPGLRVWTSVNAGASWSAPQTINNLRDPNVFVNDDPPEATQAFYAQNEGASVAYDTFGNFYVVASQHNVGNTSGSLMLHKFNFSGNSASQVDLDPNTSGTNGQLLYRWLNQDPAYNPVVAIDTNVPSFTDPASGITQTDSMAATFSRAFTTVNSATLVATGSGYTPGDVLTIRGTSNSPAQLRVNTVQAVDPVVVTAGGTGYAVGNILDVQGGTFTTRAQLRVAEVGASAAAIVGAGTGYTVNDILTVVGGVFSTPTQIQVTTVGGAGDITGIAVLTPGSYSTIPTNPVSVTGGTGTGATFNMTYGVVTAATVQTPGSYTNVPFNSVTVTGGAGTGATFDLTYGVLSTTLTSPGTYLGTLPNPAPVVGGTGLGATFNVTYTQPGIVTGGTGYAPNDVLTVQGGVFTGPARVRVTQVGAAPTTAVATGGTGYAVGNILTVQGGVFTTRAQLRVAAIGTGGVITAVTVQTPGTYFTAPGNAVSVTGGSGTGATFNLDFSVVTGATIADSGAYTTLPSNPVSVTGGGGTGATFNLATLGGTPKGIYVAWNTLFTQPQNSNPATVSRIWTRASGDGGLNFSTTEFISSAGVPAAAPQIVFTQGSADGRVAGGRMLVFWSGSLAEPANPLVFNRIVIDSSSPDNGVPTGGAVASKTFTGGRTFINDAFAPQNTPPNNIVRPTNARLGVDIIDPTFTTLNDLDVTVNIRHPTMAELRITLVAPNGTSVPLLLSGFNPFDSAAITGQGIVGANLGTLIGGNIGQATNVFTHDVNTVFDDQAPRSIQDGAPATAWAGHYRPEGGSLSVFNGLTASQLAGVWTLRIEDTIASGQTPPPQFLDSWSLTFSSIINTTGFGTDTSLPTVFTDASNRPMTTVQGSVTGTSNPLVNAASGPAGVGPGIRVAVDNTLGSFSPNQGNIYVVYTGYRSRTALTDNANDTDIMMMRSTNGGASWSGQIRVNNDTANDNFSEGTRPQYNPAAAVDLQTGTLVLTWFDARWDAARARVSTFITTSIDGGSTFSAQTYLNQAKTAIDAVTRNTVTIEPIPGNPSAAAAGALGFGTRQGLAVNAGHVYSAFASNFNGTVNAGNIAEPLSRVFFAQATIAAGPRIISGDMGPITGGSLTTDGTPRLTGFQIVFDRPIDPSTFTDDDVTMEYRDTVTLASDPATLILLPGRGSFNVVPQNLGAFGATTFLVQLTAPLSGVGTYSYAIGPAISDRIRNRSSVAVSGGNSPISQFASSVIGFSSEFSTTNWAAAQTLGAPDTQYGDNPTAWSALNADGPPNPEFVSVGYDMPVFATGVVVRESNVNGFVTQIDLIDVNDVLHTVFTGPDTSATGQLADLTVNFPATPYLVKGVKVTVDPLQSLGEWEEIDAVTLIGNLIFPASGAEVNLPVPPSGTGGTVGGIVFPTPPATNADTTNSAITVSGLTGPVQDVNVSVQLAHTRNSDLSMRLVAPSGQVILLTQRRGGAGNNGYIDVTFDDQASASVITATAPYTAVRPEGTLGVLNGMLPAVANGTWTLQVNDSVTGQTGTLLGWSISFNSPALGSVSNGGNLVDQNQDTVTGDYPSDVFAIPNPINGQPFQLPYTKDTLPLIITGPRLVDTSVASNPANINQANNTVVNGNNGSIDLTFDRDIKADSFTTANILRLMGPVGPITNYIAPPTVVFTGGGGTGAAGVVVLGPGGQIVGVQITNAGTGYISPPLVSFVSDHGVGAAATASVAGGRLTNVAIANGGLNYGIPTLAIPDTGTVSSSFKVDDSLQVNDLSVSVQLTHPRMADLTVVLVAPDGTKVQLFDGGTGTGFNNTIFDFFAPTPVTAGSGTYNGTFRPVPGVDTAVVVSGGTGYKVGDMLTVQGGTFGSQATLRVLTIAPGGAIGTVQVVRPGMYTVLPTTPASVVSTTGTGSGATFSLTLGATLKSLNLKNYLSDLDPLTPLGTWTLQITDWAAGSSGGALRGWSLNPFTVTPQGDFRAYSATIAPGGAGSGYAAGDILTVQGAGTPATLRVVSVDNSGAITAIAIVSGGQYAAQLTNPVSVTGGAGTGALFNLAFATRTFRVGLPTQSRSGTYSFTFGSDSGGNYITDVNGHQVDTDLDAGVDILRGGDQFNGTVVAQTYDSGPISTTIPEGTTIASRIDVTDAFLVQGVTLQLSITHENVPDLEATLVSPDGTEVLLFSGVGTFGTTPHANFTNTVFDDTAPDPIQLAVTVPTIGIGVGPYTPQIPLSTFLTAAAGGPVSSLGQWTLRIHSNSSNLTGVLTNWKLTLKNPVPGDGLGEPIADQFSASFRIFTQAPTDPVAQESWTAVGPASILNGAGSGRIGGIMLDPSDPSGNTAYVSGASGGVWKTNNFLDPNSQPTWVPLTDLGQGNSLNTGSIAVFGRNNDPDQSIIFVATGEGDTGSSGVGFLRSMDGGRTWRVLDSVTNSVTAANALPGETIGDILPIADARRNHAFFGSTAFKVVVDPTPLPNGEVIVYAALSGTNGGIWRSRDTGRTWTQLRAGNATDVVLAAASGDDKGNLQVLYSAFRGQGVFYTTNAPTGGSLSVRNGGQGVPLRRDVDPTNDVAIPVNNLGINPNGPNGRIVLSVPHLTGRALEDSVYTGWLYAAVVNVNDTLEGLYLTKDFGLNWTKLRIPTVGTGAAQRGTNDETKTDYDPLSAGGTLGGQGNYDIALAVDPNNPNVVFIAGMGGNGSNGKTFGVIRVDTTTTYDSHALVAYDNSNNDGGTTQWASTGGIGVKPAGGNPGVFGTLGPGRTVGLTSDADQSYYNMLRDPFNPFLADSTTTYGNVANFTNNGENTRWMGVANQGVGGDYHELLAIRDPLTGETRLVFGTDHAISSAVTGSNGQAVNSIGRATAVRGSRNGNLQITQFYYGAAQPSTLAAEVAGALFYGNAQDDGFPRSTSNVLETGDINWGNNAGGDGGGIATDQTGSGTLYEYRWPCCINNGTLATDFFIVTKPPSGPASRTTGLLQNGDDPAAGTGQWPFTGTINFAVNPIDPTAIVISSSAGRIFRTSGPSLGTGRQWFPIADPSDLAGGRSLAQAFGAPANDQAPLSDFIYVGTDGGNIFVTFNGGGVGGGTASWKNISAGLSGGSVMAIVTNPTRGSREAYAVTRGGVFWMADSGAANATWVQITNGLFSPTLTRVLYNDPAQQVATLKFLSSMQADWRFAIPDDLNNPDGPKHPVLYVGGQGGVFRSLDKGVTWTYFPNVATDGAIQEGGFLPSNEITDLDLVLGNVNPLNGRPDETFGRNLLLATSYGRGSFVIRLNDQIKLANGKTLFDYYFSKVAGPHVVTVRASDASSPLTGITVTFSGPVDPRTFTFDDVLSVTDPFGNPVAVSTVTDVTGGNPHNVYKIVFTTPQPSLGFYRVSLGPDISDFSGHKMDQDQDALSPAGGANGELVDDIFTGRFLFQPGVNFAPVLTAGAGAFPAILEDNNPNQGSTLDAFLANNPGLVTDANDPPYEPPVGRTAPRGIAVTGVDNTFGLWEYSLDGGATWLDFNAVTAPSDSTARLLEANPNTRIRFLPRANYNSNFGLAEFSFRAWDLTSGLSVVGEAGGIADTSPNGGSTAFSATSALGQLAVTPVNDVPTFTKGADVTVGEDSGPQTRAGWATAILPYPASPPPLATDEAGQALTFLVSTDRPDLFVPGSLAISPTGTLTFTPADNAVGTATVTVRLMDDGGTANGGVDTSAAQTFKITITPVNDAPVFTKGPDLTVREDAGAQVFVNWATGIAAGPPDEVTAGQAVNFLVSTDRPDLFVPGTLAISPTGTLTYIPAANANGTATVTVRLMDDGGTANGGVDTSAAQTFTITITAVNDAPSFTKGANQTVLEDSGPKAVANWATAILPYPASPPPLATDEAGQAVNFLVSTDRPDLFVTNSLAISPTGTLTFTPAPNANGTATVTVRLMDDGGTADGGVDTSAAQTFTITITPVNDAPSFTKGADVTVDEDSGPYQQANWATAILPYPASPPPLATDEAGQQVTFEVTGNTNSALFVPGSLKVSPTGTLTFTPAKDAFGVATVTVRLVDNGGTANGGQNASAGQTFTVTINPVNDPPVARDDSFTTNEDVALNGNVLLDNGNGPDYDPDGDTVTVNTTPVSGPAHGTLALNANGTFTYTPAADYNGADSFVYQISDGTGGFATATVTITVRAVNDPPTFTASNPPAVPEDSGAQVVNGWATGFNPGPPDESSQTALSYTVVSGSVSNPGLFAVPPAVDASGRLSYTPAANAFGTSKFKVQVRDSGGTANGGNDLSAAQEFTITVNPVNDAPSFTASNPPGVHNTSGLQTVLNWVASFNPGQPNEAGQVALAYIIDPASVSNPGMFSVLPAVDPATGTLTYTLASGAPGVSTFTVRVQDNGGTASGGQDTSAPQTFTIVANQTTSTALVSLGNPSVANQAVTFRATVTTNAAGVGQPTGLVRFFVNNVDRGTAQLVNGVAERVVAGGVFAAVGNYTVVARYEGEGHFNSSASPPVQQSVLNAVGVGIAQSIAQSVFAQAVTLTAVVRGVPAAGQVPPIIPPGTVTFLIDGVARGNPVPLNGNGVATLTLPLGTGFHSIQAHYNGAVRFAPGDSVAIGHNTSPASTKVVVSTNRNPAYVGQGTVATAAVSTLAPGGGIPSGTVTFVVDGVERDPVPLNGNGVASLNLGVLSLGRHVVVARYDGSLNHFGIAAARYQDVVGPTRLTAALVGSPLNGGVFNLNVFAVGADGSFAPGYNAPAAFVVLSAPSGGTISAPSRNTTFVNGLAVFSGLKLTRPGVYVIRVLSGSLYLDLTIDTQGRLL